VYHRLVGDADRAIHVQKRDPTVREIVAAWRRLTGGKPVKDRDRATIVACSGGADSSALVLALAATPAPVRVIHVLHAMRPASESRADADAVRELAGRTGCAFELIELDAAARTEAATAATRRRALAEAAERRGIRYIATGHTADDQLETLLMRTARGAGPRGMRGVLPTRPCGSAAIVRPMPDLTHEHATELCRRAGWRWREDRTNLETDRVRAALRSTVIPALRTVLPDAARGAVRTASTMALHEASIDRRARAVIAAHADAHGNLRFDRAAIDDLDAALLGAVLRRALRAHGGARLDRLRGDDVRALRAWMSGRGAAGSAFRAGPVVAVREGDGVTIGFGTGPDAGSDDTSFSVSDADI